MRHVEMVERLRVEAQARMREAKRQRKASEERLRELERETRRLRQQMEGMKNSRGWKIAQRINTVALSLRFNQE